MSNGTDCSPFFADVVKNVASPNLEIKKLVYIYLLRYAESEPDLALLSINTIQKALTDQSQLVRSMAIRVMAGIRVPVISQIVALGIKRCAADMSPYVRKAAAVAIPKCYRLDPGTLPALKECLGVLLGDRSFYVVGAAVVAWEGVCPRRWEMLHEHYRALARMLIDMDEWGQLAVLRVLTGYARANFPAREKRVKKAAGAGAKAGGGDGDGDKDGFYSDESGDEGVRGRKGKVSSAATDADLELLLRSCIPLLQSRNSAVFTPQLIITPTLHTISLTLSRSSSPSPASTHTSPPPPPSPPSPAHSSPSSAPRPTSSTLLSSTSSPSPSNPHTPSPPTPRTSSSTPPTPHTSGSSNSRS